MACGYFLLVLHAHLPYIRHPEFEEFMEERWLFEAITETYIPLLKVFENLEKDGIPFKVTISVTPPLLEMFASHDLQSKYERHMVKLIELADREVARTKKEDPRKHSLAVYYLETFSDVLNTYRKYNRNPAEGFKVFKDKGYIELITCNATHGFLPFMMRFPQVINAQIKIGIEAFQKHIGYRPKGMWIAECAYVPPLDRYLAEAGVKFFFVDSHGLWYADHQPRYGVYRPIITPHEVFVFARDPESSEQVWSSQVGYPGDGRYREFYRDVGFDREYEYIRPYIDSCGERINTGIKYHRITGKDVDLADKELYDLSEAMHAVEEHAKDFAGKKIRQIERLYALFNGVEPVIVAPFDAELFGHWWYEGPQFLERFFRYIAETEILIPSTPSEIMDSLEIVQVLTPAPSSWGANGYFEVWLNGRNDWIYPHYEEMMERMVELAQKFTNPTELQRRVLNQMARELLLAQSSDWAFIMTTGTTVEYAANRVKTHALRFLELDRQLRSGKIEVGYLQQLEWLDAIFPWLDYRIFA